MSNFDVIGAENVHVVNVGRLVVTTSAAQEARATTPGPKRNHVNLLISSEAQIQQKYYRNRESNPGPRLEECCGTLVDKDKMKHANLLISNSTNILPKLAIS